MHDHIEDHRTHQRPQPEHRRDDAPVVKHALAHWCAGGNGCLIDTRNEKHFLVCSGGTYIQNTV